MAKNWRELQSSEDALTMIREWVAASPLDIKVLPATPDDGCRCLEALQVTTRSPLGALAFHTGGLLVDHGWLRILGAGSSAIPRALDVWNGAPEWKRCDRGILIADDAVGGFFAWFQEPRTVHYLAPDTLCWEDSELGYTAWLSWALTARLGGFYQDLRWDGWAAEVASLRGDSALLIYPPLFSEKTPIIERTRKPVPVEELWKLAVAYHKQLGDTPDGTELKIVVAP